MGGATTGGGNATPPSRLVAGMVVDLSLTTYSPLCHVSRAPRPDLTFTTSHRRRHRPQDIFRPFDLLVIGLTLVLPVDHEARVPTRRAAMHRRIQARCPQMLWLTGIPSGRCRLLSYTWQASGYSHSSNFPLACDSRQLILYTEPHRLTIRPNVGSHLGAFKGARDKKRRLDRHRGPASRLASARRPQEAPPHPHQHFPRCGQVHAPRQEEHGAIFERFHRDHCPGHPKTAGTGPGSAITRNLTELHGRRIHVGSWVGLGTRFLFVIPVPNSWGTRG